jgi:predicted transcriptional regulator
MISSQLAYQRTLLSARRALLRNLKLRNELLSIVLENKKERVRVNREKQRKQLGELAALGLIDLHLDDTYNLSNIGKVLVKELQQK